MRKTIEIQYDELQFDELTPSEQELVNECIAATHSSYANYSKFNVGAALRLADGSIVRGANQENAAFTVGICAERSAIYAAQVQRPDQPITEIAICAKNINGLLSEPVTPCGSCRQVMLEMEDRYKINMKILLYGTRCVYRLKSIKDLMPFHFVDENMR